MVQWAATTALRPLPFDACRRRIPIPWLVPCYRFDPNPNCGLAREQCLQEGPEKGSSLAEGPGAGVPAAEPGKWSQSRVGVKAWLAWVSTGKGLRLHPAAIGSRWQQTVNFLFRKYLEMFPVHFHTLSRMLPTAKDVLEKSNAYKISCTCMLLKMRNKKVTKKCQTFTIMFIKKYRLNF